MPILWDGAVGTEKPQTRLKIKKKNQHAEIFPREENSAVQVTWVSLLCSPLGVPAPFLSDNDRATLLAAECHSPPNAAPSSVSTSELPPLLADRTVEQRATNLPTWLSGRYKMLSPQHLENFLAHLRWDKWGMLLVRYS